MDRNYNEVFEIEKPRRGRKFLRVIVVLILVVGVGYIVNIVVNTFGRNKADIYVPSQTYYAVSLMNDTIKDNLNAMYSTASMAGASGYVWQKNDIYYLLALIYPNLDMANSVVASNNIANFELEIVEVVKPGVEYNLEDWEEEDKRKVNEIESYISDMVDILYNLTIAVHVDTISAIACASNINNYKGDMMAYSTYLDSVLLTHSSTNVINLQTKVVKLVNIMDKMVNELITTSNIDNAMKYNFCEYIFELCYN